MSIEIKHSILTEAAFQCKISYFFSTSMKHPLREVSVADWWEKHLKPDIKWVTLCYCRKQTQDNQRDKAFLSIMHKRTGQFL